MQTILIVDDHQDTADLLSRFLRRNGYEVVTATDGSEALSLLETLTPDVMLLDQMMSNLSGIDVLDRMCQDDRLRDVPVLMFSADSREAVVNRARELGAREFLVKGAVRLNEICERVSAYAASA